MRAVLRVNKKSTVIATKRCLITVDGLTCYHGGVLVRVFEHPRVPYRGFCCLQASGGPQHVQAPSRPVAAPVKGKDCGSE